MARSEHISGVAVLGSTGSIGVSTLDVISRHPDRYKVVALTANNDDEGLLAQCVEWHPEFAVLADNKAAERLQQGVRQHGLETTVLSGAEALEQVAALDSVETVVAAIVGAAGLRSALAAARAGKRLLLANKEALVMSGRILMDEVEKHNAVLLPLDSEHNAIFQCLPVDSNLGLEQAGVDKILLTASGGPFRTADIETLETVTPEQAVAHPNWDMGKKISVDSATMMNKGLEVIEACWLFDVRPEQIQVVIHSQSVIHSMVSYIDGSVLAQLGNPDMRTPIAHALAWPERIESGVQQLDIFAVAQLDFEAPDNQRFPCLELAFQAMDQGGSAPAVLNAANEVAVSSFLDHKLPFTGIAKVIRHTLQHASFSEAATLEQVLSADQQARELASEYVTTERYR
ncbi:MAG TPA: 1-deoxy-D-xylulose-5-phosphate reductoisomerase [Gammaproteobacteria bacterium]|nr:1-deoxy-D-xylulose-5-phosphate reductoisomerase [Gammaproteobacteria bacterium]